MTNAIEGITKGAARLFERFTPPKPVEVFVADLSGMSAKQTDQDRSLRMEQLQREITARLLPFLSNLAKISYRTKNANWAPITQDEMLQKIDEVTQKANEYLNLGNMMLSRCVIRVMPQSNTMETFLDIVVEINRPVGGGGLAYDENGRAQLTNNTPLTERHGVSLTLKLEKQAEN